MDILPPQLHIHFELLLRAGLLPIITVAEPGDQGAAITGMQGMGVNAPIAAAVAAATVGLAIERHMPKGGMLTIGIWSMMAAAGMPSLKVRLSGGTTSVLGARPCEHISVAPIVT